jgi:hypothetical protein
MAQQLKRRQDVILNALGPSFRIAYREVQVNAFFERASHLWFLLFPEPEEEIRVQPGYLGDPDYQEHITIARRKVSRCVYCSHRLVLDLLQLLKGRLCWSSLLFPKHGQQDVPITQVYGPGGEATWAREMNRAIQEIVSTLPTPTWADETFQKIERLVAGLEEPPEHLAL